MSTIRDEIDYFKKQEHFTSNLKKIEAMQNDFLELVQESVDEDGFFWTSNFDEIYKEVLDRLENYKYADCGPDEEQGEQQ